MKNTIPAKILTFTLAAVLGMPQVAFAARDGEGMQYTSASEGFYGSIRTVYRSQKTDGDGNNAESGPSIGADLSRLGVRGSLDLGGGLTGVYRYEWQINGDNGDAVGNTRLSFVGLRGEWGSFVAGSHWAQDYNWVSAATDIASTGSGNFAPTFRVKNSFEYTTPDVGGLQGAFRFRMDGDFLTLSFPCSRESTRQGGECCGGKAAANWTEHLAPSFPRRRESTLLPFFYARKRKRRFIAENGKPLRRQSRRKFPPPLAAQHTAAFSHLALQDGLRYAQIAKMRR